MAEYGFPTIWSVHPQGLRTFLRTGPGTSTRSLDYGVVGHLIGHIEETGGESHTT